MKNKLNKKEVAILAALIEDAVFKAGMNSPFGSTIGNFTDSAYEKLLNKVRSGMVLDLHCASIYFNGGVNGYVGFTRKDVDKQVAGFCRTHWEREIPNKELPQDDDKLISTYFEEVPDEFVNYSDEVNLQFPPVPEAERDSN